MKINSADIDRTDLKVMRALSANGRASDVQLGETVNLSGTAAARRRRQLEEQGFISSYSAFVDQKKLGFTITVLVLIELSSQSENKLMEFEEAVLRCPFMSYCSFMSGENDFMMLINVRSLDDYNSVYRRELSKLPYVTKIRSNFLLREVAHHPVAPAVLEDNVLL
ncbi:hypothetical protein CP97_14290 [Aurantiacibacter atlanticus]|uniref:HTH asnC-type domain-containing protein n=1 Tax=Aurantiacibacter atlanticus TaxID=1648404 RepID=A0A0H4VJ95_9SPHN|nr:Lrp/AsnC family transcriptional regulator [Aurantiacibacter atlanticus]AKQ42956.1 hypothetical protein CP97_14290 [Aurantiacibacter atlanticus]MDF1834342.1 Lrp/AsnC family transcriptional regulator [Alteraurantiacibacter sp. bin_em_oilr2.035]